MDFYVDLPKAGCLIAALTREDEDMAKQRGYG